MRWRGRPPRRCWPDCSRCGPASRVRAGGTEEHRLYSVGTLARSPIASRCIAVTCIQISVSRWHMVCGTVSFPQSSGPLWPAVATKGQGSGHGWPNSGGGQTRSRSPGIEQGIQGPRRAAIPSSTQQVLRNAHQRQLGGAHRGCRGVAGHHRCRAANESDSGRPNHNPSVSARCWSSWPRSGCFTGSG